MSVARSMVDVIASYDGRKLTKSTVASLVAAVLSHMKHQHLSGLVHEAPTRKLAIELAVWHFGSSIREYI